MRDMVVAAWRTRAKEDLEWLAREIADAQRDGSLGQSALAAMQRRF
jgi:hypothetical protein